MKVSLVLVSSGRDLELLDFLKSLIFQTYKNFELIVVDQNHDSDVDRILQTFAGCLDIRHVKVTFTGTALARDYGIALTKGDIIAFPDETNTNDTFIALSLPASTC
jgi:Glycosyltransferases involved in cell wall biogenesis